MNSHGLPTVVWELRFVLLAVYLGAVAVELGVRAWRDEPATSPQLILVNIGMWLTELTLRGLTFTARFALFTWLGGLAPVHFAASWLSGALAYLAIDFVYYWKHRWLHRSRLGWALHAPHHSSDSLTLLAAIRLGWVQRVVDDAFFLPLVLLGFDPLMLLFVILVNEVYPGWCHLGVVGPLRALDGWLNTPENHRAHHALDRATADSNYASTFIVWDRLFGTWRSGRGVTVFGVAPAPGLNPFEIQVRPLLDWLRGRGPM